MEKPIVATRKLKAASNDARARKHSPQINTPPFGFQSQTRPGWICVNGDKDRNSFMIGG